jgi:hypothetical protein
MNQYTEHPTTFFKDLLLRQSYHIQKWNEQLFNETTRMNIEIALIQQSSPVNHDLLGAARFMCFKSYNRFKKNWYRANNNYTLQKGLEVHYLENDTSKPIIFEQLPDGTFSPCVCNEKKAFEEQCVHEIVVHRQKFMKNLFAKWHMRRECITCSTSPMSMNASSCIGNNSEEIPTASEWMKNAAKGTNPFIENDENYKDQKGCNGIGPRSSRNGNLSGLNEHEFDTEFETFTPCSKLKVSSNTMHKLSGEFNGNWNKASEETQTKVFAIYLELNSLLMFDGQNPSMKLSPEHTGTIDKMFSDIVVNYQKSFLGKSGNFQPINAVSLKEPNRNILQKQPKSRLKPIREIESKRFKRMKKSTITCTFCKEPGHQRTNCSRRIALQNEGTEYTMNNDVGAKIHFRSLINELESHSNVEPMRYDWEVMDQFDSRQGFRRMTIDNAYSAVNRVGSVSVPLNSMYFRITFLDKNAHAMRERIPTIISGSALHFYLQKACEKVSPVYIYNKCGLNFTRTGINNKKEDVFGINRMITSNQQSLKSPGIVSPCPNEKFPGNFSTEKDLTTSQNNASPYNGVNSQMGLYAKFLNKKKEEFPSTVGLGQGETLHFEGCL